MPFSTTTISPISPLSSITLGIFTYFRSISIPKMTTSSPSPRWTCSSIMSSSKLELKKNPGIHITNITPVYHVPIHIQHLHFSRFLNHVQWIFQESRSSRCNELIRRSLDGLCSLEHVTLVRSGTCHCHYYRGSIFDGAWMENFSFFWGRRENGGRGKGVFSIVPTSLELCCHQLLQVGRFWCLNLCQIHGDLSWRWFLFTVF